MAPRKRRAVGGPQATTPGTSLSTQAVNTHGFSALADEIYLEIMSHIPSIPIPTSVGSESRSYPEIRRLRHETLLSLSQTSRSLRRFFWRYLWQRIEVHEGMKIRDQDNTLEGTPYLTRSDPRDRRLQMYAIELVRQLEIVTVRNPQLAQYVKSVLFELFVLQFVHWSIVMLTYSLANIQLTGFLPNWRVVWVYSQTSIQSRSMSLYILEDLWRRFLNELSKSIHSHRFAMFLSCVRANPWLHLALRQGASALRHDGRPSRICRLQLTVVLVWKYWKTSMNFFGKSICAKVRFYNHLYPGVAKILTIFTSPRYRR